MPNGFCYETNFGFIAIVGKRIFQMSEGKKTLDWKVREPFEKLTNKELAEWLVKDDDITCGMSKHTIETLHEFSHETLLILVSQSLRNNPSRTLQD